MKRILGLIAATMALCLTAAAQNPMANELPNDPAVRVGKLENGLTYYIRHNDKPKNRAEFYLATHVGAIQEAPDQDGLAHFLEHMCFNGTKHFPGKAILEYLQSIGASFGGNVNAATGVEQTVYMLTNIPLVRPTVADTCIAILRDYSHFVLNEQEEIDAERPVIIEERRQRRTADWRMHEKENPYLYGDTKYATCTLIGQLENLKNFKRESIVNFYETWYHPDNQAVIVVGDIDVDEIEKKIADIFSIVPKKENAKPKDIIKIPDNKEPVIGIITDPEALRSEATVLWKREALPEEMNNTIVGQMKHLTDHIFTLAVNERLGEISAKPDAPFLIASMGINNICEQCETTIGYVQTDEGKIIDGFKALYTEAGRLKKYGFSDDEIQRAKDNILSSLENAAKRADSRKNNEFVMPLIAHFFNNEPFMEPQMEYKLMQQFMSAIDANTINRIIPRMITEENMVVIYKGPEKEGLANPTEEEFEKTIDDVRNMKIEAPEHSAIAEELLDADKLEGSKVVKEDKGIYGTTIWTLENGLEVVLYPNELEKDNIRFNLEKDGGLSLLPDEAMDNMNNEIFGLYLNNSGVSKFSATDLRKMLAGKNVSVSPTINELYSGVAGSASPKDIETAFRLAYLFYMDPRFDAEDFNTGLKTIKAMLPNIVARPEFELSKRLIKTMYGNNPRKKILSEEMIEKADINEIEKYYKRLMDGVNGARLTIVGNFDIETIKPLVEKYFGSVGKGETAKWIDRNTDPVEGHIVEDFEKDMETPQSTVIEIYHMPTEFTFEKKVAIDAVGYIMDMRYTTSLREEEGGTYGAVTLGNTGRRPKENVSFFVQFMCKSSKTDILRDLARKDLEKMANEGPTKKEFDMAVENMLKELPEKRIKNSYWMTNIKNYFNFEQDYDAEIEKAVKDLKPEDIQNIVKELLEADNHIEVIMRPGKTAETE